MACIHGCSLTQLSQTLNEFSLGLKRRAAALREPGSRLEPQCQSSPMSGAHSLPCSSSGLPKNAHQGYICQSQWASHLSQSKSFRNLWEYRALLVPRTRKKKKKKKMKGFNFFLGGREEREIVTLSHLNCTAWRIRSWIIKPQPIK